MIRIAAAGDLHFGTDSVGTLREALDELPDRADLLVLAGDLTKQGHPDEAAALAGELEGLRVPVIAVLGNHDHHVDRSEDVAEILRGGGVNVLEGQSATIQVNGTTVGVAGAKGFGGGFLGACASDFGEPEMKAFVRHTRNRAAELEAALDECHRADASVVVALMHYSPVKETLMGEPPEIYAFLGSYLLAEAVDRSGADIVFHGHAHRGVEKGMTPGGIRVRNVAQPVIRGAYKVYTLEP